MPNPAVTTLLGWWPWAHPPLFPPLILPFGVPRISQRGLEFRDSKPGSVASGSDATEHFVSLCSHIILPVTRTVNSVMPGQ